MQNGDSVFPSPGAFWALLFLNYPLVISLVYSKPSEDSVLFPAILLALWMSVQPRGDCGTGSMSGARGWNGSSWWLARSLGLGLRVLVDLS